MSFTTALMSTQIKSFICRLHIPFLCLSYTYMCVCHSCTHTCVFVINISHHVNEVEILLFLGRNVATDGECKNVYMELCWTFYNVE